VNLRKYGLVLAIVILAAGCGKKWTDEMAKEAAFKDVKKTLDVSSIPARDPYFSEHQSVLKKSTGSMVQDRFVSPANQDATLYAVSQLDNKRKPINTFFYDNTGVLISVRMFNGQKFPKTATLYCAFTQCDSGKKVFSKGDLMGVHFHASSKEVFYFDADGNLSRHVK
jgi:hypothetical protein